MTKQTYPEPIRILFVEDLPADAELAYMELKKAGIPSTCTRVDHEKGLKKILKEFRADLVICDYSLPGFSGMEALDIILSWDPLMPVIMFTGTQNEAVAVECMKSGAVDYVLKDNITRLPYAVIEAIERKKLSRDKAKIEMALKEENRKLNALNTELVEAKQVTQNIIEDLRTEIEQRSRAEEALRDSEEKYRLLAELSPNGILVHLDGKILFANPAAAKILGFGDPAEMTGRLVLDFVHPGFVHAVRDRVHQITTRQEPVPAIEEVLVRKDGAEVMAEVSAIPFPYGNKTAVQVVFTDITDRKLAEEALEQKMDELERFNNLTVDRELAMVGLKNEINALLRRLGEPEKFRIAE